MRITIMLFVLIFFTLLYSCIYVKGYKLSNGYTEVPLNSEVYRNKVKFDTTLYQIIDTGVVYEEYDQYRRKLKRLDTRSENSVWGVIRFYPNGCFNKFSLSRNTYYELDSAIFDPYYSGYRGVYYKENDALVVDLYTYIDQRYKLGKEKIYIKVINDTLYYRTDHRYVTIFVPWSVPKKCLHHKANW